MSSSKPAGQGGDEYWSDGETSALVEAWGQLYLGRNRGPVRDAGWRQMCSAVNAHRAAAGHRFDRSIAQCQWRMYFLKSRYNEELAKAQPTPGWRHFAQLRTFLAGPDDGPAPGSAAKMPAASVVKEEVEEKEEPMVDVEEVEEKEEEASGGASGSVGRKTVPAKRHFSSLQDIFDRSGVPPLGFPVKMRATAKKEEEEEEGVGGGEGPAKVMMKLADVYERVEMERLNIEKAKMEMEWEERAAKVEAENLGLGEIHDS